MSSSRAGRRNRRGRRGGGLLQGLEPFERELISWMLGSRGFAVKPPLVGRWILGFLRLHQPASCHDMYRRYRRFIEAVRQVDGRYRVPSYLGFRRLVWQLTKDGLLVRVGSEPASRPWLHERVLLELAPGAESSTVWDNPWAYIKGRR